MTQIVPNTKLNNIDEMLGGAKSVIEQAEVGMDKISTDFEKVLNKTVNKEENKRAENVSEDTTLGALFNKVDNVSVNNSSEKLENDEKAESWADFKEILSQITDEANIETSLDLTLARDINEIISQLKQAVEDTAEVVKSDDDVVVSKEDFVSIEDVADEMVADESLADEKAFDNESNKGDTDLGLRMQVAQAIGSVEKEILIDSKNVSDEQKDLTLFSEEIDLASEEVIKLVENVPEEPVVQKGSSEDVEISEFNLSEEEFKDLNIESIQADLDSSGGENLMQNQTPEEHAVKVMINNEIDSFEFKLDSVNGTQNLQQVQSPKTVDINPSRIIDQIAKHLEGLQNNSKVNIVLNPESLGKVNIQLLTTKDGLSAQFTVTTQEARDLLMKGLDGLKEALTSQGVGVDNVSVKLSDTQKSEYKQDWTEQEGSRGGNKEQERQNKEEKEKGLFERMMAQTLDDENGNV